VRQTVPPAAVVTARRWRRNINSDATYPPSCYVQHDGGFQSLYASDPKTNLPRLTEVACWSHSRRKVYEFYESTKSPLAKEVLERISPLFEIEARIKRRNDVWRFAKQRRFRSWLSSRASWTRS
jgi:hypothetical protein